MLSGRAGGSQDGHVGAGRWLELSVPRPVWTSALGGLCPRERPLFPPEGVISERAREKLHVSSGPASAGIRTLSFLQHPADDPGQLHS